MTAAWIVAPLAALAALSGVKPNEAQQSGGWNCDKHEAIADSLGLEGYRLIKREKAASGQQIEIWRNIVPRAERKPDRDDFIRVQHSKTEDCLILEKAERG